MTLTAIRGRLMLFGGSGTSAKCFNDLQILDRHDMVWLDVSNAESSVDQNSINGNTYNNNNSSDDNQSLATFRFGGGEYAATANEPRMNSETLGFQSHEGDGLYNTSGNSYPDEENTESPEAQGHNARSYSRSRTDWRSREANDQIQRMTSRFHDVHVCPNPNDEDTVPTVWLYGRGPGRRAGHTATAVNGKIYVFGGSCGKHKATQRTSHTAAHHSRHSPFSSLAISVLRHRIGLFERLLRIRYRPTSASLCVRTHKFTTF